MEVHRYYQPSVDEKWEGGIRINLTIRVTIFLASIFGIYECTNDLKFRSISYLNSLRQQ
jgi:hypothetical protein